MSIRKTKSVLVTNVPVCTEEPLPIPTLNFGPDAPKTEDLFVIVAPAMIDPSEPSPLVPNYLGLAPTNRCKEEPMPIPKLHFEDRHA